MTDNIIDFSQFAGQPSQAPEPQEEDDGIVVLTDDDGNQVELQFLDYVQYQGEEYVILFPLEQEEDEGAVVIMRVRPIDEEMEEYFPVDDEDAAQAVLDIFMDRYLDESDPTQ